MEVEMESMLEKLIEDTRLSEAEEAEALNNVSIANFVPFTAREISQLCNGLDRELLRIFAVAELSLVESSLVDQTITASAGLISQQLSQHHLKPPYRRSYETGIMEKLPENIEKLQSLSDNAGLARVAQGFANDRGKVMPDRALMIDAMAQLSKGELSIQVNPEALRPPMEDCAAGLTTYLNLLIKENEYIRIDDYSWDKLDHLVSIYNQFRTSRLLNSNFGVSDRSAAKVLELPASEVNSAIFGRMDRIIAAGKRAISGALAHTNLPD